MKFGYANKLATGFIVNLVLIASVGGAIITVNNRYDLTIDELYRNQLLGTVQLANAMDALWRLRYGFPQFMVLGPVDRAKIVAEEPKWYGIIEENLQAYAKGARTDDEKRALEELRASYKRYIEARPRWFELYGAGKTTEAADWRAQTTTPFGAETVARFERQIHLQKGAAKSRITELRDRADLTRTILITLLAVLLVIVSALGIVARRLLQPLNMLRQRCAELVQSLFKEDIGVIPGNEIDTVVYGFDVMTERFIAHRNELERAHSKLALNSAELEATVEKRTDELARALGKVQQQSQEALVLNEMGELLQSCISVNDARKVLAHFVSSLFPQVEGTLYLSDNSRSALKALISWNRSDDAPEMALQFSFDECWGLRRGKPYLVTGKSQSLLCTHLPARSDAAHLCLPLAAHGEMFGLLYFCFPGFDVDCVPGDMSPGTFLRVDLAASLAAQIGIAFSNLRLRENLRQQSIQDGLTGLYNRRYLEDAMPREIARVARSGKPLAVLMIDVDHFKVFNDQFGHEAGDVVLRALAQCMKETARRGDLVCRFGGEEFTIVLPEAGLVEAEAWGQRLMQRVREVRARQKNTTLPAISISIGLAAFPVHGEDGETLIHAADMALYEAKRAGRDRLVAAVCPEGAIADYAYPSAGYPGVVRTETPARVEQDFV